VNVRDHAESIAFYQGASKENTRTRQRLKEVVRNMLRIINLNRRLNFFTTGYNYIVILLPTVIVAPLYLKGQIEFGVVTQSAVAFGQVLNALSVIVLNFGSLSAYGAVVARLGAFFEALDDAAGEGFATKISSEVGDHISMRAVTIVTPDGSRTLAQNLSFEIATGGLLICGPSGAGKSSVLRSIMGLWFRGEGAITRPPLQKSVFIPQRPYLPLGTLRGQLLYGQRRAHG
jgi:putative ATP-binding cassette transporter